MEEQMIATLSSIWDQRRIWLFWISFVVLFLCGAAEMYLDCVKRWIAAVEVLIHEVYPQARRNHCYEADQEDADNGSWGRSADAPETTCSASGSAYLFSCG